MKNLEETALDIRRKIIKAAWRGKAGLVSSAMSIVEIITVLYFDLMRYDSQNPGWPERDRFILSKGHGSLALYAALNKTGFLSDELLDTFCLPNSILGAHPERCISGVEASTGSLGHGLSLAVGIALAGKMDRKDYKTYVILGDGECQEGSVWEAFLTIPAWELTNLITVIDCNRLQGSETDRHTLLMYPLKNKLEAFGFDVTEINGHDMSAVKSALTAPVSEGKPKLILADTLKGKGLSCMENKPDWHGRVPNAAEMESVIADLAINRKEVGL
ncbi:MAG: transketolase [Syntrophomonadaceae bacterium]|jgi:transketolase|nr:transketolase [Syntrophomonadaceae bacterium]